MKTPASLVIRVRHEAARSVVVEAAGELDLATSVQLRSALRRALRNDVAVFDAANLEFCDLAGLRTLIETHHLAGSVGCAFRIAAPSDALRRVLELTGTHALFELYPHTADALKAP